MPVIKVENLSKKYIIALETQERYTAMRDVVANKVKKIFSFPKSLQAGTTNQEEFYALKDINFEIEQGDRVGIIGRNGAGKSTLLKVLSRITEPSAGRITINGKVASLLEVGTGFHPELTGRENIFLNGAILGMSKLEIRKHFDAIVEFAEIDKFLDTPVKRYSSGMYVRLAFAVAAHLEPEILIVDEVLAVGDAQFQKKCLGKMEAVSRNEGRTILFVSHNLTAIRNLCNKGVLLNKGSISDTGNINSIIEMYKSNYERRISSSYTNLVENSKSIYIKNANISILGIQPTISLSVSLSIKYNGNYDNNILVIDIINSDSVCIFQSISTLDSDIKRVSQIALNLTADIDLFGLVIDHYTVNVYLCSSLFQNLDEVKEKLFFEIIDSPVKEKLSFDYKGTGNGFIYPITRIEYKQNFET